MRNALRHRILAFALLVAVCAGGGCAAPATVSNPLGTESAPPQTGGGGGMLPLPDSLIEIEGSTRLRGMLVVSLESLRGVAFVNPDSRRVFGMAPVGWSPHEIAVSPDRTQIFVVNFDGDRFGAGSISILSATSRREIDRLDLYPYGGFHGLAATRSGTYLYVASETRRSILEVNLLSRLIERTFPLPHGTPNQIALDPTETRLYVTDADGPLLFAVNLTGSDITETHVGEGPEGVALSPDGSALWVANRDDGSVTVLDPYTLAPITTMVSGRAPVRIAFTPDGARAVVVNAGDGSVAIFDGHTRARLNSVPVGTYPLGVAVDPDGTKAYVASTRDNDISVVDLTRNTVLERIRVGAVPFDVAFVETR